MRSSVVPERNPLSREWGTNETEQAVCAICSLFRLFWTESGAYFFCDSLSISNAANRNGSSPWVSLRMKGMRS